MLSIKEVLGDISQYVNNPIALQRISLDIIDKINNGEIEYVDASNPFIQLLETSTIHTVAAVDENYALNRKQYPQSALNIEDVFLHMTDKDYLNIYSLPTKTSFFIVFDKNELINNLITVPGSSIKKVTIARNTEFNVNGNIFSLQYPIDIKLLKNNSIQATYNTEKLSPLYTLDTNIVKIVETTDNLGNEKIALLVNAHQFSITSVIESITNSSGFYTSLIFTDQYYYSRVYVSNSDGTWNEINATYTDEVYDYNTPTCLIKVIEKEVKYSIPSIYINNGLSGKKLRIDLYETKGLLNLNLINQEVTINFLNIDDNDKTIYSASLSNIKNIQVLSNDILYGGRNSLDFESIRNRVIDNSVGDQKLPITNIQLFNKINDSNYDIITSVDTVTNRVILATRDMLDPTLINNLSSTTLDSNLISPASVSMSTVVANNLELEEAYGVEFFNTNRFVIRSDALYKTTNNITKLVSINDYNILNSFSIERKLNELNNNKYSFSPFTYILDKNYSVFKVRPYFLEKPKVVSREFIENNNTIDTVVGTDSYSFEKTSNGFKLSIITNSDSLYKNILDSEVFCQIAIKPTTESTYCYLVGTQISRQDTSSERKFEFLFESALDINDNHQIGINNFRFSPIDIFPYMDLEQEINILFLTNDVSIITGTTNINSDSLVGTFQLPSNVKVITHEKMIIKFGDFLDGLWSRAKSNLSDIGYLKYSDDVPEKYLETIYNKDPITGSIFKYQNGEIVLDNNGRPVYDIIHNKDDIVYDSFGNIIYKYRAGDYVLNNGERVPDPNTIDQITRFIDIFTIEGLYNYITDNSGLTYKTLMIDSLVNWIITDINEFNKNLLDKTSIYFYPKNTYGNVQCIVDNNLQINISSEQKFILKLTITESVYKNTLLLNEIKKSSINVIKNELSKNIITRSDIISNLKDVYGKDVIDVDISGFDNGKYNVISLLDDKSKLSIKKKLVQLPNKTIILDQDITFDYIRIN